MNFLLAAHLAGALVTLALVVASVVVLLQRRTAYYRSLARAVAVLGALQVVSGALLSWTSGATLLSFCARVGAYLAVLTVVEAAFVLALRRDEAAATTQPAGR